MGKLEKNCKYILKKKEYSGIVCEIRIFDTLLIQYWKFGYRITQQQYSFDWR